MGKNIVVFSDGTGQKGGIGDLIIYEKSEAIKKLTANLVFMKVF
jgi:hypothetical protein